MIPCYFSIETRRRSPFIVAVFQFPTPDESLVVPLLIDTGADRTILSPLDTIRGGLELGIDFKNFKEGIPSTGVGGRANTRVTDIVLRLNGFETPLEVTRGHCSGAAIIWTNLSHSISLGERHNLTSASL